MPGTTMRNAALFACFSLLAVFLAGCGPEPPSLEGRWQVSEIGFDGSVVRTYPLTIEQEEDQLTLARDGEVVSRCTLLGDVLQCTDWGGYGIDTLFVDSPDAIHSELPANEFLNRIELTRDEE